MIEYKDFEKIDVRVGKVVSIEDFPEAKKPAYKLEIDFGKDIGIKKSSVQVVKNYSKKDLIGKKFWVLLIFLTDKLALLFLRF